MLAIQRTWLIQRSPPDDAYVAVDIADLNADNVDIWIKGLRGSANARFTFDPATEILGVWSHDGKSIARFLDTAPTGQTNQITGTK